MFLFAWPEYWSATPCTISAIVLTKLMICSSRHILVTVNYLMSQNPKNPSTLRPFIPRLMYDSSFIYYPSCIKNAPPSPNPSASNAPIFVIVCSKICVSNGLDLFFLFFFPSRMSYCSCASLPSSFAAFRGFAAISFTFLIMFSIGYMTSTSVSQLNMSAPPASTKQINTVLAILRAASNLAFFLMVKRA